MNQLPQVRPISASETIPLRAEVLRPGRPIELAGFAGDEDEGTHHFGVFLNDDLVGVASLFQSPLPEAVRTSRELAGGSEWQLRGMAVEPTRQKAGLGKALLSGCVEFVRAQPNATLWCNARSSAVGFYQLNDFETRGDEFVIPDVGPHFVMVLKR